MATPNTTAPVVVEDEAAAPAQEYTLKILIPGRTIGAVIGKGGASIREITESTGAKVTVRTRDDVGSTRTERVVDIEGTPHVIASAYEPILFKVIEEAKSLDEAAEKTDEPSNGATPVPLKILVRNELIGHIIGKAGATIKQLSEDSGTEISLNQPETQPGPETLRIVTVKGTAVGLCAAQKLIVDKLLAVSKSIDLAKGVPSSTDNSSALYGSSAFPLLGGRSERNIVLVLESMIGSVIGRGGIYAKEIFKASNAKIHIETKDEKAQRQEEEGVEENTADERQVIVMGNPDCQFKAQQMIYSRLVDEDARQNNRKERRMKVHFPVQSTMLGRVIGKGGSKIKELATTSGARLKLLRYEDERPEDDTLVEIFGNFQEVQAAQNLIRQIAFEHRIRDLSGTENSHSNSHSNSHQNTNNTNNSNTNPNPAPVPAPAPN